MKNLDIPRSEMEMFTGISALLGAYSGKLSKNKGFSTTLQKFTDILGKINELQSKTPDDLPVLIDKQEKLREEISDKVFPISKILTLYSYIKKDSNIYKKHNLKKDELKKLTDIQFVNYIHIVWKDANKLIGIDIKLIKKLNQQKFEKKFKKSNDISESFGLTHKDVQEIDLLTSEYIKILGINKLKIAEKKKISRKLQSKYQHAKNILNKKLDKYISFIELEDESLYSKLMSSRKIFEKVQNENKKNSTQKVPEKISRIKKK